MIKRSLCGLTADEIRILAESSTSQATAIANCLYKKSIGDILLIPDIHKKVKLELNKKEVVSEIAKLLSGEVITDASLKSARELLSDSKS